MLDVKKDLSEFMQLTGKTQREISREAGLSPSVISQFLNGTYIGDNKEVANTLMKYLRVAKDRLNSQQSTAFYETLENTQNVLYACNHAHIENDIVLVCGDAGAGKTTALKLYAAENTGVVMVTCNSCTRSATAVLKLILNKLGIQSINRKEVLMYKLLERLKGTHYLIILDEADHLSLDALQAIRNLNDSAGVGIVLSGNDKIYRQMYSGQRGYEFDQIRTRIIVRKRVINSYTPEEIESIFVDAPSDCIPYIMNLACRESLRTAIKIYNLALEYAKAMNSKITLSILKSVKDDLIGAEI